MLQFWSFVYHNIHAPVFNIHKLYPKWFVPRAFRSSPRSCLVSLQVTNGLFVAAGRHVSPSMHLYSQRCRFGGVTANVWLRTHKRAVMRGARDTISSRRVKADSPNCWLRCVVPAAYTHIFYMDTLTRERPSTITLELSQYPGEKEDSAESCRLYMEMRLFSFPRTLPPMSS